MASSITVLTSVTRESCRSRALASAGQRQLLLTVGAQRRKASRCGQERLYLSSACLWVTAGSVGPGAVANMARYWGMLLL